MNTKKHYREIKTGEIFSFHQKLFKKRNKAEAINMLDDSIWVFSEETPVYSKEVV